MKDISKEIKELRSKTGLSQERFAEEYGIPVKTLRHWEQGQRKCPPYVIELLKFKIEHK